MDPSDPTTTAVEIPTVTGHTTRLYIANAGAGQLMALELRRGGKARLAVISGGRIISQRDVKWRVWGTGYAIYIGKSIARARPVQGALQMFGATWRLQ